MENARIGFDQHLSLIHGNVQKHQAVILQTQSREKLPFTFSAGVPYDVDAVVPGSSEASWMTSSQVTVMFPDRAP